MESASIAQNPKKESPWASSVKPVAVIVIICAIVGLLLSVVNNLTLPVVTANREARDRATYSSLIPDAADFSPLSTDVTGVTAFVEAADGKGYAVIAQSKGYSGQVPMAVAFDTSGKIVNIIGQTNTETPGLGTKVKNESFTAQFIGRPAEPMTINDIDAISGATISSKAALAAINEAIAAYQSAGNGAANTAGTENMKGAA